MRADPTLRAWQTPHGSVAARFKCHWNRRKLSRYLDRETEPYLSARTIAKIAEHLSQCNGCSQTLVEFGEIVDRLRAIGSARRKDYLSEAQIRTQMENLLVTYIEQNP